MKHTLSILVENQTSVLSRIVGLFSRRAFNINSLAVAETDDDKISRITITVGKDGKDEDEYFASNLEQILKQLRKLIDIIHVRCIDNHELLSRELVLIKVGCTENNRSVLISIAEATKSKISDVSDTTMTLELSGNKNKIRTLEKLLKPYGIKEMVSSGEIALHRGGKCLETNTQA